MLPLPDLTTGRRARFRARLGFAIALSTLAFVPSNAAAVQGIFNGQAVGIDSKTSVAAVDTALSRVGLVSLGCVGSEGRTVSGSVAQLAVPNVLSAGTVASTAFSDKNAARAVVHDVSTITGFRALGGLISADAIKADATIVATSSSIKLLTGNSVFTNLRIGGRPIAANVAPNTKIPLPGFGTATLKRITKVGGGAQNVGSVRVEMLVVDFSSPNLLSFPAGSKIIVGSASSRFERQTFSVNVGGAAFGAIATGSASKALRAQIGAVALISAGCRGTGGRTVSASSGGADAAPTLSTNAVGTTGVAGPSGGATVVRFTSRVQNTSLLQGLIRAGSIRVQAQDTLRNGRRTSTGSTVFQSLRVNGQPIDNPVPNTRVTLPGFGFVVLNDQVIPPPNSRRSTVVNALHVYITVDNALGLPIGTQLIVGHAETLAFPVPDGGAGS